MSAVINVMIPAHKIREFRKFVNSNTSYEFAEKPRLFDSEFFKIYSCEIKYDFLVGEKQLLQFANKLHKQHLQKLKLMKFVDKILKFMKWA